MARFPLALVIPLAGCMAADLEVDSQGHEIVGGSPDPGDIATVMLDLGGGLCTGTLVSPRVIMTAKHCTEGTTAANVRVYFGSNPNNGGTVIQATQLLNHPTDDISVVLMAQPGPATPIPMNTTPLTNNMLGQPVRAVGFGVTSENGQDAGLKRQGMTQLELLEPGLMYTGQGLAEGTCYGDSGGPLFMTFNGVEVVAGVTSFGTDVCERGLGGNVDVQIFKSWVDDFIAQRDPTPTPPPPTGDPAGGDDGDPSVPPGRGEEDDDGEPSDPGNGGGLGGGDDDQMIQGGCNAVPGQPASALPFLFLMGLLFRRRRG